VVALRELPASAVPHSVVISNNNKEVVLIDDGRRLLNPAIGLEIPRN
jgi:hypothetical protein